MEREDWKDKTTPVTKPCDDCAFRKGTEANSHPWTIMKANLCLITGEEFYCHRRGTTHAPICSGYDNARSNRPAHPEWRVKIAAQLSQMQELAESSTEATKALADNWDSILLELMRA